MYLHLHLPTFRELCIRLRFHLHGSIHAYLRLQTHPRIYLSISHTTGAALLKLESFPQAASSCCVVGLAHFSKRRSYLRSSELSPGF